MMIVMIVLHHHDEWQHVGLYNMAIVAGMLCLVFGIHLPADLAILGGLASHGQLVVSPEWDYKQDLVALDTEGIKSVVIPVEAHDHFHQVKLDLGLEIELVPVSSIQHMIDRILRPLALSSQPPSGAQPATSTQEEEEEIEFDDSEDDYTNDV